MGKGLSVKSIAALNQGKERSRSLTKEEHTQEIYSHVVAKVASNRMSMTDRAIVGLLLSPVDTYLIMHGEVSMGDKSTLGVVWRVILGFGTGLECCEAVIERYHCNMNVIERRSKDVELQLPCNSG